MRCLNMQHSTRIWLLLLLTFGSIIIPATLVHAQATGDFLISAAPNRVWVGTDGTGRYVIRVASINNFAGPVQLAVASVSYSGLQTYFSFERSIIQLKPNSEEYTTLTVTTGYQYTGTVQVATVTFQVTGTSSAGTKAIPLEADVIYGDLATIQQTDVAISLNPSTIFVSSRNITTTVSETLQLTLTSLAGVTTTLGTTTATTLYTMTPQAYDIPSGLYITFNPSSVTNIRGGTTQVTINVLLTPQFLQNGGTYAFAIGMNAILPATSISASLVSGTYFVTKIAVLTIVIPPAFSIAVNPTVINLYVGAGQEQIQVTVTPLTKGLTDPIVLSVQGVPSGIIGNFQTNTLIPNGTQPLSTNLVLNAPTGTLPTLGTLHFTAQSAGVTTSADASLNVQPQGDYTVQADQTTVEFSGSGQSRTITLTVTPQGGFKSTITFSAANLPAGMTATFSSATYNMQQSTPINVILTLTAGETTQPGTYQFSVVTNTGFSTKSLVLTVLVRAGSTQIWPVILVVVIVIAVVSLIAFVGLQPRGREVRRISERRGEGGYPRLPP